MGERAAFFLSKIKLKNLTNVESGSDDNDPYVSLEVGSFFNFKTVPLQNEKKPEWKYAQEDEGVIFFGPRLEVAAMDLKVQVWDSNRMRSDKFIGKAILSMAELGVERKSKMVAKLTDSKMKDAGEVLIEFKVAPNVGGGGKENKRTVPEKSVRVDRDSSTLMVEGEEYEEVKEMPSLPSVAMQEDVEVSGDTTAATLDLHITEFSCRGLANVESWGGENDLYVVFGCDLWKKQTAVIKEAGSGHTWKFKDEDGFGFTWQSITKKELTIKVYDSNRVKQDVLIGEGVVELKNMMQTYGAPTRFDVVLFNEDGTDEAGTGYIEIRDGPDYYNDIQSAPAESEDMAKVIKQGTLKANIVNKPATKISKVSSPGPTDVFLVDIAVSDVKNVETMMFDKNDLYVHFAYGDDFEYQTPVQQGAGSGGTWALDASFSPARAHKYLQLKLMDSNSLSSDTFIGGAEVEVAQLAGTLGRTRKFEVSFICSTKSGERQVVGTAELQLRLGPNERPSSPRYALAEEEAPPRRVRITQSQSQSHVGERLPILESEGGPANDTMKVFLLQLNASGLKYPGSRGGSNKQPQNDPYIVVNMGDAWTYKSSAKVNAGPSVEWTFRPSDPGATFEYPQDRLRQQTLTLQVYSRGKVSLTSKAVAMDNDILIGKGEVSLSHVVSESAAETSAERGSRVLRLNVDLFSIKGNRPCGSVLVRFRLESLNTAKMLLASYKLGASASLPSFQSNRGLAHSLRDTMRSTNSRRGEGRAPGSPEHTRRRREYEGESLEIMKDQMENLIMSNRRLQDALDSAHRYAEAGREREGEVLAELDEALAEVQYGQRDYDKLMTESEKQINEYKVLELVWNDERKSYQKRLDTKDKEIAELRKQLSAYTRSQNDAADIDYDEGARDDMMDEISSLVKANAVLEEALAAKESALRSGEESLHQVKTAYDKNEEGLNDKILKLEAELEGKTARCDMAEGERRELQERLDEELRRTNAIADERAAEAVKLAKDEFAAKEKLLESRLENQGNRITELESELLRTRERADRAEEVASKSDQRLIREKRLSELAVADTMAMHNAEKAQWSKNFDEQLKRVRQAHVKEVEEASRLWRAGQERITDLECQLASVCPSVAWDTEDSAVLATKMAAEQSDSGEYGSGDFENDNDERDSMSSDLDFRLVKLSCDELASVELMGSFDDNDPYMTVNFGTLMQVQTEHREGAGVGAEWELDKDNKDYHFCCGRDALSRQPLKVVVMDKNKLRSDVLIGEAEVDVTPLVETKPGSACVLHARLYNKEGTASGTVRLEFGVVSSFKQGTSFKGKRAIATPPAVSPQLLEHNRELRTKIADLEDRIAEYKRRETQMHQSMDQVRKQHETAMTQRNAANARAAEAEGREVAVQRQSAENAKQMEAVRAERQSMHEHEHKMRTELAHLHEVNAENKVTIGHSNNKIAELQKEIGRLKKTAGTGSSGGGGQVSTGDLILQSEWAAERIELLKRLRDAEEALKSGGLVVSASVPPGAPASDDDGTVQLLGIECASLKNVEFFGANDPYCEVNIGNDFVFKTTCYKDGGSDVKWLYDNESEGTKFDISRRDIYRQTLRIICKDENEFRDDTVIGEGVVELDGLSKSKGGKSVTLTIDLRDPKTKKVNGTAKVVVVFHQHHPSPDEESIVERDAVGPLVVGGEVPAVDSAVLEELKLKITELDAQIVKLSGDRGELLAWKVAAEARIKELRKKLRLATAEHKKDKEKENGNTGESVFSLEWDGRDVPSLLRERFGHCANLLDAARDNLALKLKSAQAMDEEVFGRTVKTIMTSKATSDLTLSVPYRVSIRCSWDLDSKLIARNSGKETATKIPKKLDPVEQKAQYMSWTDTNGSSLNWNKGFLFGSSKTGREPVEKVKLTSRAAAKK